MLGSTPGVDAGFFLRLVLALEPTLNLGDAGTDPLNEGRGEGIGEPSPSTRGDSRSSSISTDAAEAAGAFPAAV